MNEEVPTEQRMLPAYQTLTYAERMRRQQQEQMQEESKGPPIKPSSRLVIEPPMRPSTSSREPQDLEYNRQQLQALEQHHEIKLPSYEGLNSIISKLSQPDESVESFDRYRRSTNPVQSPLLEPQVVQAPLLQQQILAQPSRSVAQPAAISRQQSDIRPEGVPRAIPVQAEREAQAVFAQQIPVQIAQAAQNLAADVPPAGNDQQQQQPGILGRVYNAVTSLPGIIAGAGALPLVGHAMYGTSGAIAGTVTQNIINTVSAKSAAAAANAANAATATLTGTTSGQQVAGKVLQAASGLYGGGTNYPDRGINININTGTIGDKNPLIPTYTNPYQYTTKPLVYQDPYAHAQYTHPFTGAQQVVGASGLSTRVEREVARAVNKSSRAAFKADKNKERERERAAKQIEKTIKDEKKKTDKETKKRVINALSTGRGVIKKVGGGVRSYYHGGTEGLKDYGIEVGVDLFKQIGIL